MAKTRTIKDFVRNGGQWTKRQPTWQAQRDDARKVKRILKGSF